MPYNERSAGGSDQAAAHTFPITRAFALTILAAALALLVLRHIYGTVSVEAGTR